MDRLSGERLVDIIIGDQDPFADGPVMYDEHSILTDVPECDALGVALGVARTLGKLSFDVCIRRPDGKFCFGYFDAVYNRYGWTHEDFDLETKEETR